MSLLLISLEIVFRLQRSRYGYGCEMLVSLREGSCISLWKTQQIIMPSIRSQTCAAYQTNEHEAAMAIFN
jgi:hypothetical protein